jgi:NTP pyrophosphatase (non-canonical NTP hydrolase)
MNDFIKLAIRTELDYSKVRVDETILRLNHAAEGMSTEANEFLDVIKKAFYYNKPLDITNLKEEIGDLLWYIAIACDELDTTFEDEMKRVINKLQTRYPDKYTDYHAINRDLTAERKKLEE